VQAQAKKKKSTRKETKTKEFTHCFTASKSNYIQLLNTVLAKHHVSKKIPGYRASPLWLQNAGATRKVSSVLLKRNVNTK